MHVVKLIHIHPVLSFICMCIQSPTISKANDVASFGHF